MSEFARGQAKSKQEVLEGIFRKAIQVVLSWKSDNKETWKGAKCDLDFMSYAMPT